MNLTKLFEAQKALDERIINEKGLHGRDLIPQKVVALITELGECANEWRGFKFWSEDREPKDFEWFGKCNVCEGHGVNVDNHSCVSCAGTGDGYRNPLLEEYVDCLHFALSLVLDTHNHNSLPKKVRAEEHHPSIEHGFIYATQAASDIAVGSIQDRPVAAYVTLQVVLDLGLSLGFSDEQITDAYFAKNATNHKRQEEHY